MSVTPTFQHLTDITIKRDEQGNRTFTAHFDYRANQTVMISGKAFTEAGNVSRVYKTVRPATRRQRFQPKFELTREQVKAYIKRANGNFRREFLNDDGSVEIVWFA